MDWSVVLDPLLSLLATAVVILIGVAVNYLLNLSGLVKHQRVRDVLESAIKEAGRVAVDAVYMTKQTFTDAIKQASEDGKLTKEEAAQAMHSAVEYFKRHMSQESLAILVATYGPLEEWLEEYLEAVYGQVKEGTTAQEIARIVSPLLLQEKKSAV